MLRNFVFLLATVIVAGLATPPLTIQAMAANHPGFHQGGPNIVAMVDLSDQRLQVFRSGMLLHTWKVSTARRGYVTPVGRFTPYRLHRMWRSRKYDNAPMPYSIFYYKGYAIHGTDILKHLGRPASHGCVRLHPDNARILYTLIRSVGMKNARVVVRK